MTKKTNRTDQLRVRLTSAERQSIENLIAKRAQGETISDLIREALKWCINPATGREPYYLSPDLHETVQKMAKQLNREPAQVVEDCIQGVIDLIEKPSRKVPLIVLELTLRRDYDSQRIKKSKV